MSHFACIVTTLLAAAVAACSASPSSPSPTIAPTDTEHHEDAAPPDHATSVVIGVQAEDFREAIGVNLSRVQVIASVDGADVEQRSIEVAKLPFELTLVAPSAKRDARIDVKVIGIVDSDGMSSATEVAARLATTAFIPGETRLLRARLESHCASKASPVAGGGPFTLGPRCDAPTTCVAGACASSFVAAVDLEAYRAGWPDDPPDACRPVAGGATEAILGAGEKTWAALASGDVVTPIGGPQGGFHIWIAVATRNLQQYGSTTKISAAQPDGGLAVPAVATRASLMKSDGGLCALPGIRFALAGLGTEICSFLGKPLDITVDVADGKGGAAHTTTRVQVAAQPELFMGRTSPCAR